MHAAAGGRSRAHRAFGENLVLTRRIEAELGGTTISIEDRGENRGFRPTPHMLLYHYNFGCPLLDEAVYHYNFGCPLLDEAAELLAPSRVVVHRVDREPRAQGVGHRVQGPPQPEFSEQVYEHEVVAGPDGMASAALINPRLGQGGIGIRLDYDRAALPC